jgi:hypothetical protein
MTTEELQNLFEKSIKRSHELRAQYEMGFIMSRRDCIEMRNCTDRLRTVALELWIRAGGPNDAEFDCLRRPPPKRPLPKSMRAIDLTANHDTEVH